MAEESDALNPLRPAYKRYTRQECFVAHSHDTDWREDLVHACEEVLPKFGLRPWYADQHFDPTRPLRNKVVEAIANGCYGIYDISNWQDSNGAWQRPRNVYIELGMALALNRPALILRHTSNQVCPLPTCLNGLKILEFSGETTLKRALEEHLPLWTNVPPDRDWFNRFCIFGDRVCSFREEHPRARQLGEKVMHCHVSDGFDNENPAFADREEVRAAIADIFGRYADLNLHHLGDLQLVDGYQFLLCSHCQAARSSQFAVYRIAPTTPPEVFIAIGMSIAIETLFDYDIPKVLLVRREQDLPSLLRGYEVVEVASSTELKRKLSAFVPSVLQKVRATAWRPRPLPFFELVPTPVGEQPSTQPRNQDALLMLKLPARPLFFVGRDAPMQAIFNRLAQEPASVAIVGPAGIGKTTLATEIAWTAMESRLFPDGIIWQNCNDFSLQESLKNWLDLFGANPTDATLRDLAQKWEELIDKQRILIVLDGAEVITPRELAILAPPGAALLLTSRSNRSFPVPVVHSKFILSPLSQAESAELLKLAMASFGVTDTLSDEAATEIASASSGNPADLLRIAENLHKTGVSPGPNESDSSDQTGNVVDDVDEVTEELTTRADLEDFIAKVAHEIEAIMEREMFTPSSGGPTYIPPAYVAFLSNEDDQIWSGERRGLLEERLSRLVSDHARKLAETSTIAAKTFAVELRVDGDLKKGEFNVRAFWDTSSAEDDRRAPFKIGQTVVYPNHGTGVIEAIDEKQIGKSSVLFYSLRLKANNSLVLVPVPNAAEAGLRTLISSSQCHDLLEALQAGFTEPSTSWSDRYKTYSEWMRTGDIFNVAKVLKDLNYIFGLKPLSFREQRMLERARYLVISEVAAVLRQPETSVEPLIDQALAKAPVRPRRRSKRD